VAAVMDRLDVRTAVASWHHGRRSVSEERFPFGANWQAFLRNLTDERIIEATRSLAEMLDRSDLAGQSFLDIGCGSGLFSLAARRLGAKVRSFDFDPQSVECTETLRARYFPGDPDWVIGPGSVLDEDFVRSLGTFDVVYSWGVLHHTGDLRRALELALLPVRPGGVLFVAIYNYQVYWSKFYAILKRGYVRAPRAGRAILALCYAGSQVAKGLLRDLIVLRNPLRRYREKVRQRGMSSWYDWVDWIGGYPFEPARPEEIFDFYRKRGLILHRLSTCGGGQGCNEFVFVRPA